MKEHAVSTWSFDMRHMNEQSMYELATCCQHLNKQVVLNTSCL